MRIQTIFTFMLFSFLVTMQSQSLKDKLNDICQSIALKLIDLNAEVKTLTNDLNQLMLIGQVDYKEAMKPKSKEIIELSEKI